MNYRSHYIQYHKLMMSLRLFLNTKDASFEKEFLSIILIYDNKKLEKLEEAN